MLQDYLMCPSTLPWEHYFRFVSPLFFAGCTPSHQISSDMKWRVKRMEERPTSKETHSIRGTWIFQSFQSFGFPMSNLHSKNFRETIFQGSSGSFKTFLCLESKHFCYQHSFHTEVHITHIWISRWWFQSFIFTPGRKILNLIRGETPPIIDPPPETSHRYSNLIKKETFLKGDSIFPKHPFCYSCWNFYVVSCKYIENKKSCVPKWYIPENSHGS